MADIDHAGAKDSSIRVLEAAAIAALGKLLDLAVERYKARKTQEDRIKALEDEIARLKSAKKAPHGQE